MVSVSTTPLHTRAAKNPQTTAEEPKKLTNTQPGNTQYSTAIQQTTFKNELNQNIFSGAPSADEPAPTELRTQNIATTTISKTTEEERKKNPFIGQTNSPISQQNAGQSSPSNANPVGEQGTANNQVEVVVAELLVGEKDANGEVKINTEHAYAVSGVVEKNAPGTEVNLAGIINSGNPDLEKKIPLQRAVQV